jgi:hypothetical protein
MKHNPENPKLPVPAGPGLPEHPVYQTEAQNEAYWTGVSNGLKMAAASSVTLVGAAPDEAQPGQRLRRARVDGLSGVKQAIFLEGIAAGLTVDEAAAKAGISTTALYNFANRRAGRAFAIGWDAARRRQRNPIADQLMERSLKGQVEVVRGEDGLLAGVRHRKDNRLAMAMLTRADKRAEAYREDERLIAAVSEEFEELLDIIEAEGDAESFIESCRPVDGDYRERDRLPESDDDRKALYYQWRSPEERARLPKDDCDPYPESARPEPPDDPT